MASGLRFEEETGVGRRLVDVAGWLGLDVGWSKTLKWVSDPNAIVQRPSQALGGNPPGPAPTLGIGQRLLFGGWGIIGILGVYEDKLKIALFYLHIIHQCLIQQRDIFG